MVIHSVIIGTDFILQKLDLGTGSLFPSTLMDMHPGEPLHGSRVALPR